VKHGSLFSGIGGFDLAASWLNWENVFQVEIDDYCQKVLAKNFPNVKRYRDIKEFKGRKHSVDILSGGFPCQPFSHAGKRKGESDDRYLWPEYLRVIREIQPSHVVSENVVGLVSMDDGKTLDGILSDLEGEGYVTEQFIIPACGVGAWHRRDRIWILAYSPNKGTVRRKREPRDDAEYGQERSNIRERGSSNNGGEDVSDTESFYVQRQRNRQEQKQFRGSGWWESEPGVGYMVDGVSLWLAEPIIPRVAKGIKDRVNKLKGLGNAVCPQVVYEIFKAIEQINYSDETNRIRTV